MTRRIWHTLAVCVGGGPLDMRRADVDLSTIERCITWVLFAGLDERGLGVLATHAIRMLRKLARNATCVRDAFCGMHVAIMHLFLDCMRLNRDICLVCSW